MLKRGKIEILMQLSLLKELNQLVANHSFLKTYCFRKRWVLRLLQLLPSVEDERIIGTPLPIITSPSPLIIIR